MHTRHAFIALLLTAGAVAACSGSTKTRPPPAGGSATEMESRCPASVPGTSVTVEDTATGAALVFVTTGDVAEVRKRVAAMATIHDEHHGKMGAAPSGDGDDGDMEGMDHDMEGMDHDMEGMDHDMEGGQGSMMIAVHATASVEDVEGGARMVLVVAAGDVARLQSELRKHAEHMANGTCSMDHE